MVSFAFLRTAGLDDAQPAIVFNAVRRRAGMNETAAQDATQTAANASRLVPLLRFAGLKP